MQDRSRRARRAFLMTALTFGIVATAPALRTVAFAGLHRGDRRELAASVLQTWRVFVEMAPWATVD